MKILLVISMLFSVQINISHAAGRIAQAEEVNIERMRQACDQAFTNKNFSEARRCFEGISLSFEGTLQDRRKAAITSFFDRKYRRAWYWMETVATDRNADLNDKRVAGSMAFMAGRRERAKYWLSDLAKSPEAFPLGKMVLQVISTTDNHLSSFIRERIQALMRNLI